MSEPGVSSFVMPGAREAISGGLAHVEQQVTSLERAVTENPALAFDLAKTLVESTCRAILDDRRVAYSESDDLPKLLKAVSRHLPLLPPTASNSAGTRESLRRTLNGLSTTLQGICELRNRCGFASHGSGTARPAMEAAQAMLAEKAADAIVGFLYGVHRQDRAPTPSPRVLYDENPAFNESIDEAHGMVRIFDVEFRPSEVLFQMEPESYRVYLAEYEPDSPSDVGRPRTRQSTGVRA